MIEQVRAELASTGVLRVGVNLSNILLVTNRLDDGTPVGISPDMGAAIAEQLGVPVEYHCFEQVGLTADAITNANVDIGLIAQEAERAKTISFTDAYCEIEGTYLVRSESTIQTMEEVDQPGIRIAVSNRSAYDLFLSRTLKNAKLVRAQGLPETAAMFAKENLEVLAGLRPALIDNAKAIDGSRILDGRYMSVKQALGTQKKNEISQKFLQAFVEDARATGVVQGFIDRHKVTGKLTVAV